MKKDIKQQGKEILDSTFHTEIKRISPEQAQSMLEKGGVCAWSGCTSNYKGAKLPPGWRYIIVSPALETNQVIMQAEIDGAICPAHVEELGKHLKMGASLSMAAAEANRTNN